MSGLFDADWEKPEGLPLRCYVVLWRDKLDHKAQGLLGDRNTSCRLPVTNFSFVGLMPFYTLGEAKEEAQRISFRQDTKILQWTLLEGQD